MSAKDPSVYFSDIRKEISHLEEFTKDIKTLEAFTANRAAVYACARSIEIIGEAAKRIPPESKQKHPKIQWKMMAAMRDKLIHDYGNIEIGIIWRTVKEDIPMLKEALASSGL